MSEPESATRQCPFCKEEIKADAFRCKHCQATILPEKPAHGGVCPFCKENIHPEAIRCKHCKANLTPAGPYIFFQKRSREGFSTMAARTRLRLHRSRDFRAARNRDDCSACPPAIMEGSSMWCLVECDEESCTYEECGYM